MLLKSKAERLSWSDLKSIQTQVPTNSPVTKTVTNKTHSTLCGRSQATAPTIREDSRRIRQRQYSVLRSLPDSERASEGACHCSRAPVSISIQKLLSAPRASVPVRRDQGTWNIRFNSDGSTFNPTVVADGRLTQSEAVTAIC